MADPDSPSSSGSSDEHVPCPNFELGFNILDVLDDSSRESDWDDSFLNNVDSLLDQVTCSASYPGPAAADDTDVEGNTTSVDIIPLATEDISNDEELSTALDTIEQSSSTSSRFASISKADMKCIEDDATSRTTKHQTQFGVGLLKQWLEQNGESKEFENMPVDKLDDLLRKFYASVRSKNGSLYSKSTFVGIRASINRYIRAPPFSRPFSLLQGTDFHKSNIMFNAMLRKLKKEGMDKTKHHSAISDSDLLKLRNSEVLSQGNPRGLLQKVWFDIMLSFARRGRENLRELKADAFQFRTDDTGHEFAEMAYTEATKNHPGDNLKDKDFEQKPRMYATGTQSCPVASLKLYLSKRNMSNDIFFQLPKSKITDEVWYTSRPIGEKMLNEMMKNISKEAGLSKIYTNHCIRATTITKLSHAGVEARKIMRISGHRNEQSIRSYNSDSSDAQKRTYSSILHDNQTSSPYSSATLQQNQITSTSTVPSLTSAAPRHHFHTQNQVSLTQNSAITNNMNIQMMRHPLPFQHQFSVSNSTVQVFNYFGDTTNNY